MNPLYTLSTLGSALRNALGALLVLAFAATATQAQTIYALSENKLISFKTDSPNIIWSSNSIVGIASGQSLAGLDFRPATGQLYALGYNAGTGEARLYTLNMNSGQATAIGAAPVVLEAGMGKVGFDFNPTVDRIRVTGSNNANYRLHPVTGAIAATDLRLAFAAADVNAGMNPSIGTVAYTNSYIGASGTTLYNYDDSLNVLTTQVPPNDGKLNTVGSSGIVVNKSDPSSDMDIWFDEATSTNWAFLAANTSGSMDDKLYRVNLASGATTLVGSIGTGRKVDDIAVLIRKQTLRLEGQLVYASTANGNLISFDSKRPQDVRSQVAVSGLPVGQALAGMDFRPATGELYALGYNAATQMGRLYVINRMTGVASPIGAADTMLALGTGDIGFDFNPTVDRIRVVGANNANYRMHPVTGRIAFTDGMLSYAPGDVNAGQNPAIGAVAYTNSYGGATTTTLYDYDDSLNVIATQLPPNNGTLNTVGSSGLALNLADPSVDMDIFFDKTDSVNRAYASANTGSSLNDNFYMLNLATGSASMIGRIGKGIAVRDIAVLIDTARNPPTMAAQWPITFGAEGDDFVRGIIRDSAGNVYASLSFQGTVNLQGTSITAAFPGKRNALLAKFDLNGSLLWHTQIGHKDFNMEPQDVNLDWQGNPYWAGSFAGMVSFAGSPDKILMSQGSYDAYTARFDATTGLCLWATRVGSAGNDYNYALVLSRSGNVYTGGSFGATMTLSTANGAKVMTNAGGQDGYIVKMDGSGNILLASQASSPAADEVKSIEYMGGDLVVCGYMGNGCQFGSTTLGTLNGSRDGWMARINSLGQYIWVKNFGSIYNDEAQSVTVDRSTGNVFAAAQVAGPMLFNGTNYPNSGGNDIAVVGYNFYTQAPVWASQKGSTSGDAPTAIKWDGERLVVGGYSSGSVNVAPGLTIAGMGGQDGIILHYNTADGMITAARTFGAEGNDRVLAIDVDKATNAVYAAGRFNSTVFFPDLMNTGMLRTSNGGLYDGFIFRYQPDGFVSPARLSDETAGQLKVYPVPATQTVTVEANTDVQLLTMEGKLIGSAQPQNGKATLRVRHLSPGIYMVRTQDGKVARLVKE